ncbi:Hypothetical Protein RradSPS_2021 [Rubrobacter radiotolerans]|uniref:DUF6788 domain-containing protein n=1 Tax=Rubrobacter radiotolerans TaxID=42256 RepID=A0A023X5F5_RUBRA|nr:hypothetical protein [Rubrobacter radiotolerans]AHY47304.1 Hypothetical Protein RradSPS_2021 [Rubrobacter radiotolerans]MDX5894709.1 hypothetical protein [Rubrobacter radiotolerans]SMC06583.1 conserved hypothetical protein [Rubrobacter radiotolerans DSM 5868]
MDLEGMIAELENLNLADLERLARAVERRIRTVRGRPVSGVLEYRPHADGTLQAEVRRYYRKDGQVKEQGPYWYFRYHEDGKQKKLYLGKTEDPAQELVRRRGT